MTMLGVFVFIFFYDNLIMRLTSKWFVCSMLLFMTAIMPIISWNVYAYLNDAEFVESVQWMYDNNMTRYNNAADFRPWDFLTREQAAKFFDAYVTTTQWSNAISLLSSAWTCEFSDLWGADSTLLDHIVHVCFFWYMKWSNGIFRPTEAMTKAEAITILVRIKQWLMDETVDPWWKKYYKYAYIDGITKAIDVWSLDTPVTRYEMALLLSRAAGNDFVWAWNNDIEEIIWLLWWRQWLQRN